MCVCVCGGGGGLLWYHMGCSVVSHVEMLKVCREG